MLLKFKLINNNSKDSIQKSSEIMIPQPHYQFKFVLVGDSSVGKSSILTRFVDDQFKQDLLATIGVDFKFRRIKINGQDIKIQIWDTAGQQTFRSLVSAYYHSADAILIVYDVTFPKSFQSILQYWIKQAQNNNKNNALIFLLGNKSDQALKKNVQENLFKQITQRHNIQKIFQVSAKVGTNIEQSFTQICKILISKNKGVKNSRKSPGQVKMHYSAPLKIGGNETVDSEKREKKKCCN